MSDDIKMKKGERKKESSGEIKEDVRNKKKISMCRLDKVNIFKVLCRNRKMKIKL